MITTQQREARRALIGSSDVPALCNVDPYRSLYDLWLEKTGKLEDRLGSEDADRGTDLEPYVLDMFERRMGVRLERNVELRNGGVFGANLDGAIRIGKFREFRNESESGYIELGYAVDLQIEAVVEAKTTVDAEAWGEPPDDIPLRVFVQVQAQMMMAACSIAYIPVLIPKYKRFHFEVYQVLRHDELIAQIKERGEWFWERHVQRDIPPPDTLPHLEALKRIRREPQSLVHLDDEAARLWTNLEIAKQERKRWEQTIEEFQAALLQKLGDAEAGELPDGSRLTYLEQNGAYSCDWQLLQMRLRECGQGQVYDELVRQARFRVLRHKKAPR